VSPPAPQSAPAGRASIADKSKAPYRGTPSGPAGPAIDPQSEEGKSVFRQAVRRLSQHTFAYAAAEQLSRLAGFLLIPLYTGYLTEADYGTRELLAITVAVLVQLAGINVTTAMHRTYFENDDAQRRRKVVSTTYLTVAGISGLLALGLMAGTRYIVPLFPSDYVGLDRLWMLVLGIFFFQMVREVQNKFLQAEQRSLLYGGLSITKLVVEISLQIYFLVFLGWGIEGLFGAVLLSEATFCLVLAFITLPRVGLGFSPAIFVTLATFTLPLIPNGVFQFCLHSADRYMLGWMTDTESVGIYGLAYKLGYVPNYLIVGPFLLIWYPFLFSLGDERKQALICGKLIPYFMLIMTGIVFALSTFSREIVELMARRPGYHAAWTAIPVVCLGYWFWSLFHLVQTGFYVKKITKPLPWITGAVVLVNIYANLALIPLFGFMGAAASTVITFGVLVVITRLKAQEVFPIFVSWRKVALPGLAAALLFAGSLWAADLPEPWPLSIKVASCVVWFGWVWAGGFFDREERHEVVRLLGNYLRRENKE
jgi:O-antigen/teichoic acid export membrane protein